jgi:hypothetical protein
MLPAGRSQNSNRDKYMNVSFSTLSKQIEQNKREGKKTVTFFVNMCAPPTDMNIVKFYVIAEDIILSRKCNQLSELPPFQSYGISDF